MILVVLFYVQHNASYSKEEQNNSMRAPPYHHPLPYWSIPMDMLKMLFSMLGIMWGFPNWICYVSLIMTSSLSVIDASLYSCIGHRIAKRFIPTWLTLSMSHPNYVIWWLCKYHSPTTQFILKYKGVCSIMIPELCKLYDFVIWHVSSQAHVIRIIYYYIWIFKYLPGII